MENRQQVKKIFGYQDLWHSSIHSSKEALHHLWPIYDALPRVLHRVPAFVGPVEGESQWGGNLLEMQRGKVHFNFRRGGSLQNMQKSEMFFLQWVSPGVDRSASLRLSNCHRDFWTPSVSQETLLEELQLLNGLPGPPEVYNLFLCVYKVSDSLRQSFWNIPLFSRSAGGSHPQECYGNRWENCVHFCQN